MRVIGLSFLRKNKHRGQRFWLPPLTRIAESARGGAGSVGERLQKYSSFAGFLPNEEYTAAIHDFAEPNLPDQQLPAQAPKEFHIIQAAKLIACLRLAHRCVRSERQMAGEQPCRPVKCVPRRLNRMGTT